MIIALLRREPAIKQLPLVLGLASAGGLLLGGALFRITARADPTPFTNFMHLCQMAPLLSAPLALCYRATRSLTRFGEWEAVLPLPGSTILSAHLLGLALPGTATILVFTLGAGFGMLFGPGTGTILAIGFNLAMAVPLGVVLLHATDVARARSTPAKAAIALTLTGFAALLATLEAKPVAGCVLLALALAVGWRVRVSLPRVLDLAEDPPSERETRRATPARLRGRTSIYSWLLARAFLNWRGLLHGVVMLFAGAMLLLVGLRGSPMFGLYLTLLSASLTLLNFRFLDTVGHLPVSRARVFAALVLPGITWLAIAAGVPIIVEGAKPDPERTVRLDSKITGSNRPVLTFLQVPLSHWRVWSGGPAPVIAGPDQRERKLTLQRIFPGTTRAIYNPYECRDEWVYSFLRKTSFPDLVQDVEEARRQYRAATGYRNRVEKYNRFNALQSELRELMQEEKRQDQLFCGWQLSRALADVHGIRVPPDEAYERYVAPFLEEGDYDTLNALVAGRTKSDPRRWPGVVLVVLLAWFLCLLMVIRPNRGCATRDGQQRALAMWLTSVGLFAVVLVLVSINLFRDEHMSSWWIYRITHAVTSPVPATPWALWSFVVAVFAACWLILLRRFRHVEPPQNKKNPITGRTVVVR